MTDVGDPEREIEVVPLYDPVPKEEPVETPEPEVAPEREPDLVPV